MFPKPRKRFGQNFLQDPAIIDQILAAIAPQPGDRLVEIGPGRGAITQALLRRAGQLDVVELDRDLIEPLRRSCQGLGHLTIHQADALTFELCSLAGPNGHGGAGHTPENKSLTRVIHPNCHVASRQVYDNDNERAFNDFHPNCLERARRSREDESLSRDLHAKGKVRVVGNLPYNISTPLLFRFLDQKACTQDLHLMLQKEVVERIVAPPGSRTYGRLSVMVQTWCQVQALFDIPSQAFFPAPKVQSAFLRLLPLDPAPLAPRNRRHHAQLVALAFSQRRKTLRNSLKDLVGPADFARLNLDPGQRAEDLPVSAFVALADLTCNTSSDFHLIGED